MKPLGYVQEAGTPRPGARRLLGPKVSLLALVLPDMVVLSDCLSVVVGRYWLGGQFGVMSPDGNLCTRSLIAQTNLFAAKIYSTQFVACQIAKTYCIGI